MTRATGGYFSTTDSISSPAQRWLSRFHRQRGPIVRYWDKDFHHIGTEPQRVESWTAWTKRQLNRLLPR